MSLLDTGAKYQPCTVYPEIAVTDVDGNTRTKPSPTGIPAIARFQVQGQSGTSARRAEQDNEGYMTEKVYRMRFPRSFTKEHGILGAQSVIEWGTTTAGEPAKWAVFGDASVYDGSVDTARVDYTIKRY